MNVIQRIVIFTIGSALLVACGGSNKNVMGNGNVTTQTFDVADFSKLSVASVGEVTISVGSSSQLTVRTDENLMQHVMAVTEGDTLHLTTEQNVNVEPTDGLRFQLTIMTLDSISVSGSATVTAETLSANDFKADVSGSGDITIDMLTASMATSSISGSGDVSLAGSTNGQIASISGSGDFEASALQSSSAEIDVSGSGTAIVWATNTLYANVSGSGDITYIGSPEVIQSISGSGNVQSAQE